MLVTAGTAVPAAAGDDEKIRQGGCSGSADWKLKVKTDDGRLEVEGEIDSNVNGQTWRWRITHNGSVSARGRKTTRWAAGSFDVSGAWRTSPGPTPSGSGHATTARCVADGSAGDTYPRSACDLTSDRRE